MDFSRLPAPVFLKILEYLPLENCIRVGRVNKTFRQIAQLATSRTKYLDLTEDRFQTITPYQLAVILNLCSPNLERIKIQSYFDLCGDCIYEQIATTLAHFKCPRLIDMNLADTPIDYHVFERLIRNCPKMESLEWNKDFVGFPPVTNNNLKKVRLNISDDASLQTLIGRCPNLEEMVLHLRNISATVINQFVASIPRVQRIDMNLFCVNPNEFETKLVSLWNLNLTCLSVMFFESCGLLGDNFLRKVATSFPFLKELTICLFDLKPTNQGIGWLADLQELQVLQLALDVDGESYDQGFRQLANCKKLRKLDVFLSKMTGGTLVNLIRSCSQLEYVGVLDITEIENPEQAAVIVNSLAGIPKRDITIQQGHFQKSIWKGEPAKAAIKKLEEDDGLKMKIKFL